MISKSKSKEKSKVKDSKNYQATEYHQRKVMSSRLPTSEHGTII